MENRLPPEVRSLESTEAFRRLPLSVQPYAAALELRVLCEDGMLRESNDTHYLLVGASALNAVLAALALAGRPTPQMIFDFGAGAGRVLRWLRAAFPDASIDACDLRDHDVGFCATYFAARTWQSGTDIRMLEAAGGYDLVWVGSVLTHLPPLACAQLLDKLLSWCAPDGLLVFSTVGRVADARPDGERHYHPDWSSLRRRFASDGIGYADYGGSPGYGLTIAKPSWYAELIEANPDVRLVMAAEAVWDDHQDVWALQKRPISTMVWRSRDDRTSASTASGPNFETALLRRHEARTGIVGKLARRLLPSRTS